MAEQRERIKILAKRWIAGVITEEEKEEFEGWYGSFDDTQTTFNSEGEREALKERLYTSVLVRAGVERTAAGLRPLWRRVLVAASVILALGLNIWLMFPLKKQQPKLAVNHTNLILPGSNCAILTLSGGKKIVLAGLKNGTLAKQGPVNVLKTADGRLAYSDEDDISISTAVNLLETPRGGQYHLTLSDGTQVWLNAASSIKFPVSFTGSSQRQVQISGEAYFEVAKDKNHPFVVNAGGQTIEVLGTHFNINSYSDEPSVITTLLEGSVKVINAANGKTGVLKPGQQSLISGNKMEIKDTDTEEATAWKDGYFMFDGESIGSIMRKVSRWYNVDIVYDRAIPVDKFEGTVNRFGSVQQVLKKLELTERVHFKITERRIIVSQ